MSRRKKRYYVVYEGRESAICTSWEKCSELVTGYSGAKFKGFFNLRAAEESLEKYQTIEQ